jgi:hypothetical protein
VRVRLRSLARDPFLNEAWTVLEFDSAGFADGQEFHRVAIDLPQILEIDRPDAVALGKRVTKDVQRRSDATAADTEDYAIVFGRKPVDSARHGSSALSAIRAPADKLLKRQLNQRARRSRTAEDVANVTNVANVANVAIVGRL